MAARYCLSSSPEPPTPSPVSSEAELGDTEDSDVVSKACVSVKYGTFFELPDKRPTAPSKCIAKSKLCQKNYKYTLTSKGNLLKHLETAHNKKLVDHREEQRKKKTELLSSLPSGQCTLSNDGMLTMKPKLPFPNQGKIVTSIVKNLCGRGGLPLNIVEQDWFRDFMRDVEPKFERTSRVAFCTKLNSLYEEERRKLLSELANKKPTLTVDFWTDCNNKSFMGATVHYIQEKDLKSHVLYFVEVKPPHSSEVIKDSFEIQLDNYGISCFQVVTDNAANMRQAFELVMEAEDDDHDRVEELDVEDDGETKNQNDELQFWKPIPLKIEGWIGCNAHLLQLVVHDGFKELRHYPRVQSILAKAKAIATLSQRSSHFTYALNRKLPVPCDTRWNSYFHLYDHIVKHFEEINEALKSVSHNELLITKPQGVILLLVVKVLQFFSEATNILQGESAPTANRVIPVNDSLENDLLQTTRDNAAINAFCEALLTSIKKRFGYLLHSKLFQAAVALDPTIKLSFTDHQQDNKFFSFSSDDVKQAVKALLPTTTGSQVSQPSPQPIAKEPTSKKKKLMDFCSISDAEEGVIGTGNATNDAITEIKMYFAQPRLKMNAIEFWGQQSKSQLSALALQLLSVPCSSAPVERLVSKPVSF